MSDHDDHIATEVISASLGGAISASVLYPLEVLKTKLQAETSKPPPPPPVLPSSAETETESEDTNDQKTTTKPKSITTPVPTNTLSSSSSWTMWQYAKHVAATEGGYGVFWDGVETSALQSAIEKALYFFAYTLLKQLWKRCFVTNNNNKSYSMSTTTNLFLGCCAEWCHLPITLPLDCWTTYIQTQSKKQPQNGTPTTTTTTTATTNHGPLAMFLALLSEKGWAGLYKGWQAYFVLCFKPALQYTVFEQVKSMLLQRKRQHHQQQQLYRQYPVSPLSSSSSSSLNRTMVTLPPPTSLGAMESFVLGMVARVVATVLTFPYIRAKVMLQSQKGQSTITEEEETATKHDVASTDGSVKPRANTSMTQMLYFMYEKDGLASWYQGIGPELTRGVLSAALMLMIKEQLYVMVDTTIYGPPPPSSSSSS